MIPNPKKNKRFQITFRRLDLFFKQQNLKRKEEGREEGFKIGFKKRNERRKKETFTNTVKLLSAKGFPKKEIDKLLNRMPSDLK